MLVFVVLQKVDKLPRNQRKESWKKKKEEMEVSQRQAVSGLNFHGESNRSIVCYNLGLIFTHTYASPKWRRIQAGQMI